MKFNKVFLLILLITFCYRQTVAQTEVKLIKKISNEREVYFKDYSITEYRSRPLSDNKNVPSNELFQNQEWILKRFFLFLKKIPSGEQEDFWEYNVELKIEQQALFDSLIIKDVALSEQNGYVLYSAFKNLYVTHLIKDEFHKWNQNYIEKLATSYETKPILEAKFKSDNLGITVRYYTDNQKYGLWRWRLKNNNWHLTSDKLIKENRLTAGR